MSGTEEKIIEGSELKDIVTLATKPVLEIVESAVLKALAFVDNTVQDHFDENQRKHIEASIYEEVAIVCASRVMEISKELKEEGDAPRSALIHAALSSGMKEVLFYEDGEVDEPKED